MNYEVYVSLVAVLFSAYCFFDAKVGARKKHTERLDDAVGEARHDIVGNKNDIIKLRTDIENLNANKVLLYEIKQEVETIKLKLQNTDTTLSKDIREFNQSIKNAILELTSNIKEVRESVEVIETKTNQHDTTLAVISEKIKSVENRRTARNAKS
jgi:chromosome segregation ATPase